MRKTGYVLVLLVCACGGATGSTSSRPSDPTPNDPADPMHPTSVSCASLGVSAPRDAVFDALTAVQWKSAGCGSSAPLPPTCTALELRRDGTYTLRATSDYTERDDAGAWTFAADDGKSGLLCLDGAKATPMRTNAGANLSSALHFRIDGGKLSAGALAFSAGNALASNGSATGLHDINVPSGFARIAGRGWQKTNAFDRFMLPDVFDVDAAGHFTASYRDGACTHKGVLSWDKNTLIPVSDPNACDTRGPTTASIGVSNEQPRFLGDVLVLYQASFRPKGSTGRTEFFFDPYSDSLQIHGAFDGALRAGVPTPIDFTFENRDTSRTRTFQKIAIAMTPLAASGTSFTATGPATTLAERTYSTSLPPSASASDTVSVTPPAAGDAFSLEITIDYADALQPYHGSRTYVTAIFP